jgi:chromate reductase
MATQLALVGLTGSLREGSANRGVLRAARDLLPADARLEILALDTLPYYTMDLEADEPASVRRFKEQLHQADAVLIATPECNGSIPGVLKNALDWASRPFGQSVLAGKPTAITGAGGRGGTARAQEHLRQILTRFGVAVLEAPEVSIANSWEKFAPDGQLQDETTRDHLRLLVTALLERVSAPAVVLAA